MSAIRDGRVPVELGGKTLHLLFSLNVIDELQDRVDDLDKLDGIIFGKSIKDLKWLLAHNYCLVSYIIITLTCRPASAPRGRLLF